MAATGGWFCRRELPLRLKHPIARRERRADRYAMALTGNRAAFISALRKLTERNPAEMQPNRMAGILFHCHRSIAERTALAEQPPR